MQSVHKNERVWIRQGLSADTYAQPFRHTDADERTCRHANTGKRGRDTHQQALDMQECRVASDIVASIG
eukprot:6239246-Alexandrium_andersonii.AAC.1